MYRNISKPISYFIMFIISILFFTIVISILMLGINHGNSSSANKSILPFNFGKNTGISKQIDQYKIRIFITKENKIVELNLEEYIKGVVSGEMPGSFELEALKAQAVAARTYALAKIEDLGGKPCDLHPSADICDTVHCQVYIKSGNISSKVEQAVISTKNEIISYEGKPITCPLYFSSSGGRTENSDAVFSNSLPYLRSVESLGEDKNQRTTIETISTSDFIAKVNKQYPNAKLSVSQLKNQVKILSTNEGGTVNDIKIGKETIKGKDFRELFILKSANFTLNISSKSVEITSIGSGHDVGMSQYGANNMAKSGYSYKDILTHFYQGTDIRNIDN